MATRKSNKTAHVLNLISKAKEEHQSAEDDFEINTIDSSPTGDLSFINSEVTNDNELSEKIKENLSKIIDSDVVGADPNSSYDALEKEEETIIDKDETTGSDLEDDINEPEEQALESEKQAAAEPEPEETTEDQKPIVCKYVNVIEEVVKLRVDEFMDMFEVCKCPRCRADVIALALNELAPKYIVVEEEQISPLLNYFSNSFRTAVTAQLSRACTVVKENPHH